MPANLDLLDTFRALPAFRRLSVPKAPEKPKTIGDYAKKAALVLGRPVGLALQEIGDVLSRPVTALSEGYGAYEKERDPLEAAYRGFTEGPSRARYPTFGERLVPEEEGEGVGRKLARVGAEILTDPTTYVGPGLVKGVGRAAVGGVKLAAGTKVAEAIAKSKPAEALARLALPIDVGARYGNLKNLKWGSALVRKGKLVEREVRREYDAVASKFTAKAKELGLLRGEDAKAKRLLAADVIEGKATSADPAVNEFARYMQDEWEQAAKRVSAFGKDPVTGKVVGPQFMVRHAGGAEIPFEEAAKQFGRSYYPQMLNDEALKRAMTTSGFSKQAERLAKELNITPQEARTVIEERLGTVKRAGHIEYGRMEGVDPLDLERDPLKVFPRYMAQVLRREATAKQFGVQHEKLNKMIERAVTAGLPEKMATDIRMAVEGRRVTGNLGLEAIAPKILGFQTITKMGPTSSIAQLSQNVNNVIIFGARNFGKGLLDFIGDSPLRKRTAEVFHQGLMADLEREIGTSTFRSGFFGDWGPKKYLGAVGFTRLDRGARKLGYAAGRAQAQRMATEALEQGKLITPELRALGLRPKDVREFGRTGKFSSPAERTLGEIAAERAQFTTDWTDLPPAWRTPEMRIAMQFKNFTYQQTRMMVREVIRPAARYFETGGKEGDIAPLVRAMIAFPIAGQGVAALRDLFQEQTAQLIGAKRRKPRKFDENHPVGQMLTDSLYVGAFGMAGDVLQQASRGRLVQWALGPTVSDVTENLEFGARHVMAGKFPKTQDLLARLYRHAPGRRALPLEPQEIVSGLAGGLR